MRTPTVRLKMMLAETMPANRQAVSPIAARSTTPIKRRMENWSRMGSAVEPAVMHRVGRLSRCLAPAIRDGWRLVPPDLRPVREQAEPPTAAPHPAAPHASLHFHGDSVDGLAL